LGIGLYTRISEDIDGAGLGVARQEADCRKLASLRGWTVGSVYTDNDVSARTTGPIGCAVRSPSPTDRLMNPGN
jgi:hypothetical protein